MAACPMGNDSAEGGQMHLSRDCKEIRRCIFYSLSEVLTRAASDGSPDILDPLCL